MWLGILPDYGVEMEIAFQSTRRLKNGITMNLLFINEQKKNQDKITSIAHQLGVWGEQQAIEQLKASGFEIIQQNYHSRFGEIDIIALREEEMVFVEVKARAKTERGTAIEVVTLAKQRKMIKTVLYFLEQNPQFHNLYFRFDLICFDFHQRFAKSVQHDFCKYTYDRQWIENAFTLDTELINL